jgi:D-lyxose ketol-isomerase
MEPDQVITAVKKETGIKLSAADPVLAAAAINAVLLDAALVKLNHSIEAALGKFAAFNAQNEAAAKRAASEVINSAADWLGTRFKEAAQEATAEMLVEMRKETAKAEKASRIAVGAAYASGIIGAGALSAILGFGLAGL